MSLHTKGHLTERESYCPLCLTDIHEYYSSGILIILDYTVIFMICYHKALHFPCLCSCYIHAGGDDMATLVLFRSQWGDLLPAQHQVSPLWPTSAVVNVTFCLRETCKRNSAGTPSEELMCPLKENGLIVGSKSCRSNCRHVRATASCLLLLDNPLLERERMF